MECVLPGSAMSTEEESIATTVSAMDNCGLPGRFTIYSLIGSGGMGTVYRAYDTQLGRDVAIKILQEDLSNCNDARQRFLRETRTLAALAHPNIVKIHTSGLTTDSRPYQITELLEGESLASLLKRETVLPLSTFKSVILGILDALDYAHSKGVVHRDIKPSNIFLCRTDNITTPILIDFGIARSVEGEDQDTTITQTDATVGSPLYMSPEQCKGQRVNYLSDIYSLGCVMYECLCGSPPYGGETALATMYKHMSSSTVPKLNVLVGGRSCKFALSEIVQSCLKKDPDQRPQSSRALGTNLADALDEMPANVRFSASRSVSLFEHWVLPASICVSMFIALVVYSLSIFERAQELTASSRTGTAFSGTAIANSSGVPSGDEKESTAELTKLTRDVARLQSRFNTATKDQKTQIANLLLERLLDLRATYWANKRYDEYLAYNNRMIELTKFSENGTSRAVSIYIDAFNRYQSLAKDATDPVKAAKLWKQAQAALIAASDVAAQTGPSTQWLDVRKSECLYYAVTGRLSSAMTILESTWPVARKVQSKNPLQRVTENLRADWIPAYYTDLLYLLENYSVCHSMNDKLTLCQMLLALAEYLNEAKPEEAKVARNRVRTLLREVSLTSPSDSQFKRYTALAKRCG